jgi:ATP-dependent Clp protease ATP-binding subunit ClpA
VIGMPRGIVGSERGGVLTNQLKDNPYCVVLLDEVEKASPNTLNLFLQAFDEGWMTDGRGKRVYLSDAIIIMTSNIGAEHFRKLTSPLGFKTALGRRRAGGGRSDARARTALPARSSGTASTKVVLFAPLTHDEVREIATPLPELRSRLTLAKAGKTLAIPTKRSKRCGEGLQHRVRAPRFRSASSSNKSSCLISARWKRRIRTST